MRQARARAVQCRAVALVRSCLNLASTPAWSQTLNMKTPELVCLEVSIDAGNAQAAGRFGEGGLSNHLADTSLPSGSYQH